MTSQLSTCHRVYCCNSSVVMNTISESGTSCLCHSEPTSFHPDINITFICNGSNTGVRQLWGYMYPFIPLVRHMFFTFADPSYQSQQEKRQLSYCHQHSTTEKFPDQMTKQSRNCNFPFPLFSNLIIFS